MKTVADLSSGKKYKAGNCGIPYRIEIRDRMLYFYDEGMSRCLQFVIWKNRPHELLYVEVRQPNAPICHVARAGKIAEHFLGPDHYRSLLDYHKHGFRLCLGNAFSRKTYGLGLRIDFRLQSLWWAACHWYRTVRPEKSPVRMEVDCG